MTRPGTTRASIAWRGFVTHEGEVIARPMLMAEHNDFHRIWHTTDDDFAARWRQWTEDGKPDFDVGAAPGAPDLVNVWLRR